MFLNFFNNLSKGYIEREINDFRQHKDGYEAFRFKDALEKLKIKAGVDNNNEMDTTKISSLAQKLQMKEKYHRELKETLTEVFSEYEALSKTQTELDEVRAVCLSNIDKMGGEISELAVLREQLNQFLEDGESQSVLLRAEIEECHQTLQNLNAEIYSLELESDQSLTNAKQLVEDLNVQIDKATNEEKSLSEMIAKEELTIATLLQELEKKKEEKITQEQYVKNYEMKLSMLREEHINLQASVNNLEKEIADAQAVGRNIKDTIYEKQTIVSVGFDVHQINFTIAVDAKTITRSGVDGRFRPSQVH